MEDIMEPVMLELSPEGLLCGQGKMVAEMAQEKKGGRKV